ncbi:Protein of unknown function [Pyronema omphalodes CBS 100304]|uniref:Uncharacterized protein n=1 Tax=Pyronema omphalodes (strain CBS 100304) TaxID=1076935 RepID=U4LT61_PYROM|nr:Protein of unknown function [Pyronema omphalodes CBS 100304]
MPLRFNIRRSVRYQKKSFVVRHDHNASVNGATELRLILRNYRAAAHRL